MPIYMQEDHQQVIERIKGKIKDLSIMMGEVLPENVVSSPAVNAKIF